MPTNEVPAVAPSAPAPSNAPAPLYSNPSAAHPSQAPPPEPAPRTSTSSKRSSKDGNTKPNTSSSTLAVDDALPTPATLARLSSLLVLDAHGESRPFADLVSAENPNPALDTPPRHLLIFIRHFFCGNCQAFVRALSRSITPESLLALPTPTFITIIGCGRPSLIDMYEKETGCAFPIYCDPSRRLYEELGLVRTLELGNRPEYLAEKGRMGVLVGAVQGVVQGLKTGKEVLNGGDMKQNGGEFLFEGGECVWAHRMRNTRDHAEVEELRRVLGLDVVDESVKVGSKDSGEYVEGKKDKDKDSDKEKEKRGKTVKEGKRSSSWGRLSGNWVSKAKGETASEAKK